MPGYSLVAILTSSLASPPSITFGSHGWGNRDKRLRAGGVNPRVRYSCLFKSAMKSTHSLLLLLRICHRAWSISRTAKLTWNWHLAMKTGRRWSK